MSKKILIFIIIIMSFVICFLFINRKQYEIEYVEQLHDSSPNEKISICVFNIENELELIEIECNVNNKTQYILDLFDIKRNCLPINYRTVLYDNIEINKVIDEKPIIELYIEDLGKNNLNTYMTSLIWSLKFIGYDTLKVIYENKIYYRNSNCPINIEILNDYDHQQTIYHVLENSIKPITYYHNRNNLHFLIDKLLIDNNYIIQEDDKSIFISIMNNVNYIVDKKTLDSIYLTLFYDSIYFDKNIVLIYNDNIVYEIIR